MEQAVGGRPPRYVPAPLFPRLRNDLYCVEWDVKL